MIKVRITKDKVRMGNIEDSLIDKNKILINKKSLQRLIMDALDEVLDEMKLRNIQNGVVSP